MLRKPGIQSPPSRRRGLKPWRSKMQLMTSFVASLAEAWIETPPGVGGTGGSPVASLAEAWIETPKTRSSIIWRTVASLAEAWIETCSHWHYF